MKTLRPARAIVPLAVASLFTNVLIVLTGGTVRLTGSGLGCPTWPRCTEESYVPRGELGVHGAIEFGNRLVTFLLAAVAIATLVAAWRLGRRSVLRLALLLALGVPAQAVIGGITVLTALNPWIVAMHLLVSLAMIGAAVVLLRRLREGDGEPVPTVPSPVVWLARAVFATGWVVLYLGTVVTGSGPHAGDADVPRNGLDPASLSQLHTDFVFLLLGLTVGILFAFKAVGAPRRAMAAAWTLLAVEVAQGAVGFVQYFTGLPILLVGLHLLGAALVSATVTWVLLGVRDRPVVIEPGQAPAAATRSRRNSSASVSTE